MPIRIRSGWPRRLRHLVAGGLCAGLALQACATAPSEPPAPRPAHIERIEMLHDPSGQLDIHAVAAAAAQGRLEPITQAQSAGSRKGTVWLRLSVWGGHDVAGPHWLLLNSPLVREAQLYTGTATGFEAGTTAGLLSPLEVQDLPSRLPVFEISPPPGYSQIYFLRLQSDVQVWIDPQLLRPAQLLDWFKHEHVLLGLLIAGHVLLMVSSLWFAWYVRDRSYGWLAALTSVNLLYCLGIQSLLLHHLLPDRMEWFMPLVAALWTIRVPLIGAFVLSHLRADRHPLARGYLLLLAAVAVGDWLLSLQGGPQIWARWSQGWAIAQLSLFVLFAAYGMRRGTRGAGLLLLGMLPPLFGSLQSMAVLEAGQPLNFWSQHGLRLGFAGFLILMQYAAIRRYRDLRLACAQAQARALAAARNAEKQLGAQVAARTRELDATLATARAALAAEERSREEQRQFFLTMQHELRTPLAVIDAANRNLQHDLPAGFDAGRLRCERIGRAVEQLQTLLSNALQQKRLDQSQATPRLERIALRPLLCEAHDAARLVSPDHMLVLELDALPTHWVCDPALTALALRTLAVNAVKYTPVGTRVTIRGHNDASGLYLEVHDDGPGVSPDELAHLFERYYRARSSAGIPGTGLGLPLARKMIAMQGGRLIVDSVEHAGFTAVIWLPGPPVPESTEA